MKFIYKCFYTSLLPSILLLFLSLGSHTTLLSQCPCDNPGGFSACIEPIVGAEVGDIECVDFTAYGFTNLESIQFSINYDIGTLSFMSCEYNEAHDVRSFCDIFGDPLVIAKADTSGILNALFFTFTGEPATLPEGEVMFTLCFEVVGQPGINSAISISNYGISGGIEVQQNNGDPNNPDDGTQIEDFCTQPAEVEVSCTVYNVYARGCGAPAGDPSGIIRTYACGGTGPYMYTINGDPIPGSYNEFDEAFERDLLPGSYTIVSTDALGNMRTTTVDLTDTQPLTVTMDTQNPSCPTSSLSDGRIQIIAEGGTGTYNYNWEIITDEGTEILSANIDRLNRLGNGTYKVSVTDEGGCVAANEETLFAAPITVIPNVSREARCEGRIGNVQLDIRGGTAPYEIDVTFPDGRVITYDDPDFSLEAGVYSYIVTDNAQITCSSEEGTFEVTTEKMLSIEGEPQK